MLSEPLALKKIMEIIGKYMTQYIMIHTVSSAGWYRWWRFCQHTRPQHYPAKYEKYPSYWAIKLPSWCHFSNEMIPDKLFCVLPNDWNCFPEIKLYFSRLHNRLLIMAPIQNPFIHLGFSMFMSILKIVWHPRILQVCIIKLNTKINY